MPLEVEFDGDPARAPESTSARSESSPAHAPARRRLSWTSREEGRNQSSPSSLAVPAFPGANSHHARPQAQRSFVGRGDHILLPLREVGRVDGVCEDLVWGTAYDGAGDDRSHVGLLERLRERWLSGVIMPELGLSPSRRLLTRGVARTRKTPACDRRAISQGHSRSLRSLNRTPRGQFLQATVLLGRLPKLPPARGLGRVQALPRATFVAQSGLRQTETWLSLSLVKGLPLQSATRHSRSIPASCAIRSHSAGQM